MTNDKDARVARGAFWASVAFYGLVSLEFFYMASPFAAYIYGVYGPGLSALELTDSTSWLIGFFMPHITRETLSPLLDRHETVGAVLLSLGLIGFSFGAVQVYWSKLRRRAAVVGGVYRWIRHPQYLALMVASFGMLLIWPRYLVLFGFVTMCFLYYVLARVEERLCRRAFPDYAEYAARTGMFLPRWIERPMQRIPGPRSRAGRVAGGVVLYSALLLGAFVGARAIHDHAVDSLFVHATPSEVYLSLGRLEANVIAELARIARSDPAVLAALAPHAGSGDRLINYVMPVDLLVSEVPMYLPDGTRPGHQSPRDLDQRRYKIIFTRAHFGAGGSADGRAILRRAVNKSPIVEVWIDREAQRVKQIFGPPADPFYDGMPVPVF